MKQILFDRIDEPGLNTLAVYERRGGYSAAQGAGDAAREVISRRSSDSGLRGRGGAGFRMGQKASFLPHGDMAKYLVCNADESEPGTFKDRELMQKSPHMLIEGIADRDLGRRDPPRLHLHPRRVRAAGRHPRGGDRRGARRPATSARTSSARATPSQLVLHRGAGAYICGEETGLLDSLEGKRGNPRLKPPFPAIEGLYHGPTLINNVETLATVPAHHPHGRRRVRQDRHRDLDRHQARLGLGRRAAARQLRDRARHPRAARSSTASPAARPRAARSSCGSRAARARRC